jgi:hypothetical protein
VGTRAPDLYRVKVTLNSNGLEFNGAGSTFGVVRNTRELLIDPDWTQIESPRCSCASRDQDFGVDEKSTNGRADRWVMSATINGV